MKTHMIWLFLAAPGCFWLPLAVPGCPWLLLAAPGCSQLPLAAPGWPLVASGCSWSALAAPWPPCLLGCSLAAPWLIPDCFLVFLTAPWLLLAGMSPVRQMKRTCASQRGSEASIRVHTNIMKQRSTQDRVGRGPRRFGRGLFRYGVISVD